MLTLPSPEALFAPLAEEEALLLAVSGGPDSVALMLLAAGWSLRGEKRIEVATVDHGLRPESEAEARRVGSWARDLGFPHRLLRWEGEKPATRLQERARMARYGLLRDRAREIAPDCAIVTAHHADDQAETILFRLTRGSGVAGLSGMAERVTLDGARLLRPLLSVRKAALEALCDEAGQDFFRDPSNENEAFARARLRALSPVLAEQGLDVAALLRLGARARRADEALRQAAERLHDAASLLRAGDETAFDSAVLRDAPRELLQRVLALDIARRGLSAPRYERLERAGLLVSGRLQTGESARITLAGLMIDVGARETRLTPAPPRRAMRQLQKEQ
jgi:tRNA(Ile)-lysidine synthase